MRRYFHSSLTQEVRALRVIYSHLRGTSKSRVRKVSSGIVARICSGSRQSRNLRYSYPPEKTTIHSLNSYSHRTVAVECNSRHHHHSRRRLAPLNPLIIQYNQFLSKTVRDPMGGCLIRKIVVVGEQVDYKLTWQQGKVQIIVKQTPTV